MPAVGCYENSVVFSALSKRLHSLISASGCHLPGGSYGTVEQICLQNSFAMVPKTQLIYIIITPCVVSTLSHHIVHSVLSNCSILLYISFSGDELFP